MIDDSGGRLGARRLPVARCGNYLRNYDDARGVRNSHGVRRDACRAVHTMRAVDHYFPGQRNRRQFVMVRALKAIREWRKGKQKINWNRNICNIDSTLAKQFDSRRSTIFEGRVSLMRQLTEETTLGAAAPRIELDWASLVLSPSALWSGRLLCAVPLKSPESY